MTTQELRQGNHIKFVCSCNKQINCIVTEIYDTDTIAVRNFDEKGFCPICGTDFYQQPIEYYKGAYLCELRLHDFGFVEHSLDWFVLEEHGIYVCYNEENELKMLFDGYCFVIEL